MYTRPSPCAIATIASKIAGPPVSPPRPRDMGPSVRPSVRLSVRPSVRPLVILPAHPSVGLSIQSIHSSVGPSDRFSPVRGHNRPLVRPPPTIASYFLEVEEFGIYPFDLIHRQQDDHRVRGAPRVVGTEASPQRHRSLLRHDLHGAIAQTLERHTARLRVRLHVLQAALEHIKGQREERR
eukprot:CAMPEP_0182568594 /NCGR_PEP_ID=MMETSP1324-20130603/9482_1 /TAXON_ID=236786 /ORGANISM="Florenciella sp., Strain RCC1587" /LENGTH=180 /DNA_ID=CAMNT_0024782757 /DNA_START=324 /DNA_END=862 /DNA_ORIENTATION=+